MPRPSLQREQVKEFLARHGMARLTELHEIGATSVTVSRMEQDGELIRLSRGLYQMADAPLDTNHALAEAAKRVPKGVMCLVSALAFHELTDQLPRKVWVAIGQRDWKPVVDRPLLRVVRFSDKLLSDGVESHSIEGVDVRIFDIPKTIADCFRHRSAVGLPVAIEGLQEALRQRKATPSEIVQSAARGGVASVIRPYLEALTANG